MNEDLRVYAKGLAFDNGVYDLRTLEIIVTSYREIFDRLVAVQLGKKKVPQHLKNQLDYNLKINQGSIEFLVEFVFNNREYISVCAADGGEMISKAVVTLLRDAVTLREKASEILSKGLAVNINISNSFNVGSKVGNNSVTCDQNTGVIGISDHKILWAAQVTRTPVNRLLSQIDGKLVEYIDIENEYGDFRLVPEQRHILGVDKEELPTTLNIIGRLDVVAFSSGRGSIISDGERFSVTWSDGIRSKMQRIADIEGVVFTVRPVIDHKRLSDETIGFHILDCDNLQGDLSL